MMTTSDRILARADGARRRLRDPSRLGGGAAAVIERAWVSVRGAVGTPGSHRRYVAAVVAVASATLLMLPVRGPLGVLNVLLVYLLLTFALALGVGSGPAALAALLSFLALNFFFIPPFYTFGVAASDHLLALFVYLGVAVATGQLVARLRARTDVAEREQRRTALLYELNAALVGDVTLDAILVAIVERVVAVYGAERSRILLPDDAGALTVRAGYPAPVDGVVARDDLALATWAIEHRKPAGLSATPRRIHRPHPAGAKPSAVMRRDRHDVLYLPIATAHRVVGVLEVVGRPGGGRFGRDDERLLGTFAAQAALALERARLTEAAARAAALAESDALKSALLAAVSHDLRTPLAAIKASATSLLDPTVAWRDEDRAEFLHAIDEEADRLSRLVGNLLDLSRIEGGALRPEKEWYDVAELVADVAGRLTKLAPDHRLTTDVEPELPLARFDYSEIAQVLMNVGENAAKYTPAGTTITLAARRRPGAIELAVADDGPGIPARFLPHVFERFWRADRSGNVPGTGIGLTISKGLVEAHGGRIWIESGEGEGTTLRFTLPLPERGESGR